MKILWRFGVLSVLSVLLSAAVVSADVQTFEINDEKVIHAFTQGLEPIIRVPSGSRLIITTQDCYANLVRAPGDLHDPNRINPATGPIYIEGAEPGDVLEIFVERIEIDDLGVMAVANTFGLLRDRLEERHFGFFPIRDGRVIFNDYLSFPVRPMIGVLGVAPQEGLSFSTGTPHSHGGNMDSRRLVEGVTVFLPIAEQGAMLATGDLHALQGDGEIAGTGVEISGRVTLTVNVRKDLSLNNPVFDDGENLMVVASANTLDEAAHKAASDMFDILYERLPLDAPNLIFLMGIIGDLQISQAVNPTRTVRFSMPKAPLIEAYGFEF